jgi:hypothetical protein
MKKVNLFRNNKGQFVKGYKKPNGWVSKSPITQKGHTPWNKGKTGVYSEAHKKYISDKLKGHTVSKQTREKLREKSAGKIGEKNSSWKGDSVGYSGLHAWVSKNLVRPKSCLHWGLEKCRIEWANKSRQYKRDLNDWLPLCKKCHGIYDRGYMGLAVKKYSLCTK